MKLSFELLKEKCIFDQIRIAFVGESEFRDHDSFWTDFISHVVYRQVDHEKKGFHKTQELVITSILFY